MYTYGNIWGVSMIFVSQEQMASLTISTWMRHEKTVTPKEKEDVGCELFHNDL